MRRAAFLILVLSLAFSSLAFSASAAAASRWEPLGPFGGPVRYLTADPMDPRVAYAGDDLNGLFRTADGGLHWTAIHGGANFGAVAVDPSRPRTLYLPVAPGRLLRTVDAGAHWTDVSPPSLLSEIVGVAVDPAQPARVYAASRQGVWVSADRGETWREPTARPLGVTAVVAVAKPAGTLYAAALTGVFRSRNGGLSWSRESTGLPVQPVLALAAAASNSSVLYASLGLERIFRSVDAGETWQPLPSPAARDSVISLAVSPRSPRIVYAGTRAHGLFVSTDGGQRWRAASPRPRSVPALSAGPGQAVWAGTLPQRDDVGGVFLSTNGGAAWARRNQGLALLPAITMAVKPDDSDVLWAGLAQGFFRSADGGRTWTRTGFSTPAFPTRDFPVVSIAVDAASSSRVYALTGTGLFRSEDAGLTWTEVFGMGAPPPHPGFVRLWADPAVPGKLWVLSGPGLAVSTDGGLTWTAVPVAPACQAFDLAFAPSRPSTLYVALSESSETGRCTFLQLAPAPYRSTEGGVTWTKAAAGLPATAVVVDLSVDPLDPLTVYAALSTQPSPPGRGVWKTTDGGVSWVPAGTALDGLIMNAVEASPLPGVVWAAPQTGPPYRSGDFGATWQVRAAGLQAYSVSELVIDPSDPRFVYAVTSSGVWRWVEE
jgi:photosystem II stability/assembly factor-like uncharacterized protein